MIYDEPEAGIDLWSFARLTETFEQIHAAGQATMILISHQERIISLADEVIVVGDGAAPPGLPTGDPAPDSVGHAVRVPGADEGRRFK